MSEPHNQPPAKKPSDPAPSASSGIPARDSAVRGSGTRPPDKRENPHEGNGDSSPDILSDQPEPTDDSPTIISKNLPRAADSNANGNRDIQGRRLAHFELIEQIGVGGMAAVLRARDTQLDRFVALKILPPDMAADQENVKRFHQEARAAAKLDHENIARVFFCGEDQRLHFIAFEFVEGDNLRTILEHRGRLPYTEALPYIIQIAAGLCHAAERGVVHRDIKPSNIIITPTGRAKLVDMGLARSLEPRTDKDLTHSGVTLGTFDYISPEQALEPREADVRSDIYSLGCTFYHILTGQPPVPEGTAARKLHAHQHVKPRDPRELVPGLPDEIAQILARMMDKRPGNRYQTADDLVRHLLAAARTLGSTVEVPEGVLFVETALPTPPDNRMLVLAGLAVLAVLAFIFLADFSGPPPPPAPQKPPLSTGVNPVKDAKGDTPAPQQPVRIIDPPNKDPKPVQAVQPVKYRCDGNALELANWLDLHRKDPKLEIQLSGDLTLKRDNEKDPPPGLYFPAEQEVIIQADPAVPPPTIRITYDTIGNKPWTALTIEGPNFQLIGVRIEIDALNSEIEMNGLLLRGQNPTIRRCTFVQAGPDGRKDRQLASVFVEAKESTRLNLEECCFLSFSKNDPDKLGRWLLNGSDPRGQDAVVCRGGSLNLQADNCAFGPHTNLFRLEGASAKPSLTLRHCSALMANRSALFYLEDGATASLDVRHSLFSRPGGPVEDGNAVLVRQTNNRDKVAYTGRDNGYHNLDAFWSTEQNLVEIAFKDYTGQVRDRVQDKDFRVLTAAPWKSPAPLKGLEEPEPTLAFQVDNLQRELRQADDRNKHLIGVERLPGISFADNLPVLDEPKPEVARKERIVDPNKEDDSKNNIFSTLRKAVEDVKPGDVILIRHNGELRVKPVRLEESTVDLTIRPDEGFHPILTLDDTTDLDAALFRLHDGKIHLENLEFRLQPRDVRFRSQVLVNLVGEGECELKDCLVTLDLGGHETQLALVTLPPADGFMKSEPKPERLLATPHLVLKNSVVRGQGHLLWSRAGRSIEVDATNALVAVTGSFLLLEGASESTPASPGPTQLRLNQVTTFLGGHLIHWNAGKDARGFPPVHCKPIDCLFLPPTVSGALVHLDGPETDTEKLKEKLIWTGGRNAYGSYTNLFDQKPVGEDSVMVAPLTADRWRMFAGESTMSKFKAKLTDPLPQDFTRIMPGHFKLMELTGFGIDPTMLGKHFPNTDMP